MEKTTTCYSGMGLVMLPKEKFWNQKISHWEQRKYKKLPRYLDVNSSVKFRLNLTAHLLNQISKENRLLELGCGSGFLWNQIQESKIKHYTGVDFSESAVHAFQKKIQKSNSIPTSLFCEDCTKNTYSADIIVSLGLLDWISIEKIAQISEKYKKAWYLHSFSEKRHTFSQFIHKLYSKLNHKVWTPQYRPAGELISIFGSQAKIYRNSKLSFSTFIYRLPSYIKFP